MVGVAEKAASPMVAAKATSTNNPKHFCVLIVGSWNLESLAP
jgi:hypothetical protein